MQEILVQNTEQMGEFASKIAASLIPGSMIGLVGELGAGKTTFVRSLVAALGSKDPVSSPTFVVEHQYTVQGNSALKVIQHWDLYRLNEVPEDLYEPVQSDTIRIIEWVDKFEVLMQSLALRIDILLPADYTLAEFDPEGEGSPRKLLLRRTP